MGGLPVGYLQAWLRIWTRDYRETNPSSRRGRFESGTYGLHVQHSNHLATPPPSMMTTLQEFEVQNFQCSWVYIHTCTFETTCDTSMFKESLQLLQGCRGQKKWGKTIIFRRSVKFREFCVKSGKSVILPIPLNHLIFNGFIAKGFIRCGQEKKWLVVY